MPKLTTAIIEGTGFESYFVLWSLSYLLAWDFCYFGVWGSAFCFDFAKCNTKATALVSYADLVKKKVLHILLVFYAFVKFFSKAYVQF